MKKSICTFITHSMAAGTSSVRRAFTLVELLVVISIISILIALLLPALAMARGRAIDLKCIGNMHGANLAFQNYFNDFKGYIPPLAGKALVPPVPAYGYGTWYNLIAPYAGITLGTSDFHYDHPYGLSDPGSKSGDKRFPQYLYAMLYSTRFKPGLVDPKRSFISNRVDDFASLSETGLLVDNGGTPSSIYWMTINWALLGPGAGFAYAPTHGGRGAGVSFMDGHAIFIGTSRSAMLGGVHAGTPQPYGDYGRDIPWVHKTFWGRYLDGTYAPFSTNYPPYAP